MDIDPHTLHKIIQRIEQQMRCPQCGDKVPVDFSCLRLTGDDFLLMQLRCDACDAYIVLHASLQGTQEVTVEQDSGDQKIMNASSSLCLKDDEVEVLRAVLQDSGGSFEKLFEEAQDEKSSD